MPYFGAKPADAAVNTLAHTTTIGDGTAADALIKFDGNAQDFHIGLDDTADDLVIGLGSALGTTTHMSFDEAGIISMPLQPSASVHLNGNQSVNNETWTKLAFALELHDINNDFASNKFTVPVAGIYIAIVRASAIMADADHLWTAIRVNDTEVIRSMADSSMTSYMNPVASGIMDLDAADYIEGFVYHLFGSARDITGGSSPSYTHMQVHKLA